MTRYHPRRNEVYTIEQIYDELKLRDGPHLGGYIDNPSGVSVRVVVQDAQCLQTEIIKAFEGKSFRYLYETSEWIPVFEFMGNEQEFLACVDTAVDLDPYLDDNAPVGMVVWPKGTTYEQYYKLSDDGTTLEHSYGKEPVPPRIKEAVKAFNKQRK